MSLVPQDPILFAVSLFSYPSTKRILLSCGLTAGHIHIGAIQGTVASNIAYGAPDTPREEIERAARQANCDFIWDMKDGFDTQSEPHRLMINYAFEAISC